MSEYIDIAPEFTDDPDVVCLRTNLVLAAGPPEHYPSLEALEEGSPLAQALAMVPGITAVDLAGGDLTVTRDPDEEWPGLIADLSAALKEFFL